MKKTDISKEVHQHLKKMNVTKNQSETNEIVDIVIDVLRNNILKGKTVEITEFGTFSTSLRRMENLANPGTKIDRWIIKFTPAWLLKKQINEKQKQADKTI